MAGGDEECSIHNSDLELLGSGRGDKCWRYHESEQAGQELEIQVFEVENKIREVIRKLFDNEVVEVDILEYFECKQEGIWALEQQNEEDSQSQVADDSRKWLHTHGGLFNFRWDVVVAWQGRNDSGVRDNGALGINDQVGV